MLKADEVMKKSYSIYGASLERSDYLSMEHYFAVRYGDIVVLLYHEDMRDVRDLLFENSRKEKTLNIDSQILISDFSQIKFSANQLVFVYTLLHLQFRNVRVCELLSPSRSKRGCRLIPFFSF